MAVTSNDIANQAIMLMGGNQPLVTGQAPNFDTSTAGIALSKIYSACVATVARQFEWDMARNTVTLTLSGNTPPADWTYEYLYPANGVEVWQIRPQTLTDVNNPTPTTWAVANNVISGQQQRVIQTNVADAIAIYNNNPNENTWDATFREAVVRLLASELAIAVAGKPDTGMQLLNSGNAFEQIGEGRKG